MKPRQTIDVHEIAIRAIKENEGLLDCLRQIRSEAFGHVDMLKAHHRSIVLARENGADEKWPSIRKFPR